MFQSFKVFLFALVIAVLVTSFTTFTVISALAIATNQQAVALTAVLGSFLCVFVCVFLIGLFRSGRFKFGNPD
jgi:hypothetical protein